MFALKPCEFEIIFVASREKSTVSSVLDADAVTPEAPFSRNVALDALKAISDQVCHVVFYRNS